MQLLTRWEKPGRKSSPFFMVSGCTSPSTQPLQMCPSAPGLPPSLLTPPQLSPGAANLTSPQTHPSTSDSPVPLSLPSPVSPTGPRSRKHSRAASDSFTDYSTLGQPLSLPHHVWHAIAKKTGPADELLLWQPIPLLLCPRILAEIWCTNTE